jgi:hypothetical protein
MIGTGVRTTNAQLENMAARRWAVAELCTDACTSAELDERKGPAHA